MVRLKKGQEAFEIVDGPDAGLKFERDKTYDQAPKGYEDRFDKVSPPKPPKPVMKPELEGDKK